jgi:FkbM family methyltransferase
VCETFSRETNYDRNDCNSVSVPPAYLVLLVKASKLLLEVIDIYRRFVSPQVKKLLAIASPVEFLAKKSLVRGQILHIGAHEGEEASGYSQLGFENTLWVEAQPDVFEKLKGAVGSKFCLQGAVWSRQTTLSLNISNNSVSSSVLAFGESTPWKDLHTLKQIKVKTLTLTDVIEDFNDRNILFDKIILVLDIQGAEFEALATLTEVNKKIVAISCEVSIHPTYENGAHRKKIIIKLLKHGYFPLASFLDRNTGHGDQLFVKVTTLLVSPRLVISTLLRIFLLKAINIKNSMMKTDIA